MAAEASSKPQSGTVGKPDKLSVVWHRSQRYNPYSIRLFETRQKFISDINHPESN